MSETTDETIKQIRSMIAATAGQRIENADATVASLALPGIDLRPVAQLSVLDTPFTNQLLGRAEGIKAPTVQGRLVQGRTGRASGRFGTAEEGKRGGQISLSGTLSGARHRSLSVEWGITDEAYLTTQVDYDTLASYTAWALAEARRRHHVLNLFGRTTGPADTNDGDAWAPGGIGSTPTPSVSISTNTGSIGAGTYSVIFVALNGEAYYRTRNYVPGASWSLPTDGSAAGSELLDYNRPNADGTTTVEKGGTAIKSSAVTTGALTGSANAITASVNILQGALGYAVFAGVAGSEVYQGTVSQGTVTLTSLLTGSNYKAAAGNFTADNSADPAVYDGILTRLQGSTSWGNSGARILNLTNGAALTPSANAGIAEWDVVLQGLFTDFDGYSPDYVLVSGKTFKAANIALLGNPSSSKATYFSPLEGNNTDGIAAGIVFQQYRHPVTSKKINIVVDPYLPDGIALFGSKLIPNAVAGTTEGEAVTFYTLRDFWGETWPRTARHYSGAVHLNGSLFLRAPSIFGIVGNIAV